MHIGIIQSNRETLRRLDKALSVSFIAMFVISVIILAFAVHQIMIAKDLRQKNSELALFINNLHVEIEDLIEENQQSHAEMKQLHAEIKHLHTEIKHFKKRS